MKVKKIAFPALFRFTFFGDLAFFSMDLESVLNSAFLNISLEFA
jgi:hypothetical protein